MYPFFKSHIDPIRGHISANEMHSGVHRGYEIRIRVGILYYQLYATPADLDLQTDIDVASPSWNR